METTMQTAQEQIAFLTQIMNDYRASIEYKMKLQNELQVQIDKERKTFFDIEFKRFELEQELFKLQQEAKKE